MPIRDEDWKAINKTIADAIDAAIKPLKPQGWKKMLHVLQQWGVLAVNVTVILGLLALAATQFYQANTRLAKEAAFEATTDLTLKGIQGDIAGFKTDVAKLNLALSASKPIAQFKASLPELRTNIAIAQKQSVKASPKLVSELQDKLNATDTDAPNFWPTAAEFISYRSFVATSWSRPHSIPRCTDAKPAITTMNMNFQDPTKKLAMNMGVYKNCLIALDSPIDGERLNAMLFGDIPVIFFNQCVIVYRGGPITIKIDLARANRVVASIKDKQGNTTDTMSTSGGLSFVDCLFDFSVQQSPESQAQELTKLLLRTSTPNLKLPIVKTS